MKMSEEGQLLNGLKPILVFFIYCHGLKAVAILITQPIGFSQIGLPISGFL